MPGSTADKMDSLDRLSCLLEKAKRVGAESADALLIDSSSLSVGWRGGNLESLEDAESEEIGLRVLIGRKQAIASSTALDHDSLNKLVNRVVAMAKTAPEDPFCGLAEREDIATSWPAELDLADAYTATASGLIERAREAEESALAVKGVTQCESADASAGKVFVALMTSNGFAGQYRRTSYSVSVSALVGEGLEMERDYDFDSRSFYEDLAASDQIGRRAGERAVKNLGARKMPTCKVPVVFDPREANSLLGHLASALSGPSIARGTSFLKDFLNKQVFASGVTITDDPFRPRGLRSKAFDAEGLLPSKRKIIDRGYLTSWLLDLRSARQLGLKSTAHARRGPGSLPSPSPNNFYIEPGILSPNELIKNIKEGFYVTELMGSGVNGVTGDYSRAARGFWIENGNIVFPVNEMTIAGNLKDMFLHMTVANDLEYKFGIDSPTLCVEGMTSAGL